jgi:toxin YoeB
MELKFSDKYYEDFNFFKKSGNKKLIKKIDNLLASIEKTPYNGIRKPEPLKYELAGLWSRHIDDEHRIVYEVFEDTGIVNIISLKGHYE